jgi:tetratricopeptide (TPR) repeat protein
MFPSLRFASALIVLLACLVVPSPAACQDALARTHFEAGTSYYEAGDYEDALREFQRAHDLSQRPELLYNLSLCHQQLGAFGEAARLLERYLEEAVDVPHRPNLERRLRNLRQRAAEEQGTTQGRPTAGGEPGGDGDPLADPTTDGGHGDGASGGSAGPPVAAIAAFAAGGLGLVAAAIAGPLALAEASSLRDQGCGETRACDAGTLRLFAGLADAGVALAAVGATLGVVFLLTMGDDEDPEGAAARLVPYADPRGAGALLEGRF